MEPGQHYPPHLTCPAPARCAHPARHQVKPHRPASSRFLPNLFPTTPRPSQQDSCGSQTPTTILQQTAEDYWGNCKPHKSAMFCRHSRASPPLRRIYCCKTCDTLDNVYLTNEDDRRACHENTTKCNRPGITQVKDLGDLNQAWN
jgi:hypothetical protein